MDKYEGMAVIAAAMLLVAGVGALLFYDQAQEAAEGKDELAARGMACSSLMSLQASIQGELASVYENLTYASSELIIAGLDGTDAREVLGGILSNVTYGVDAVTIDATGTIIAAEPAAYQGSEGTDISDQPQVQAMMRHHLPVMSEVFVMVEGFTASDMEVPVFDGNGTFTGSVSVTLDMERLIQGKADLLGLPEGFQVTCLQDDGLEVYDTDADQIGRNLFTDPAYQNYTETLDFMRGMLQSSSGYGTYEYYQTLESRELVGKEVYWTSIGMHGASWTLLVIHVL